MAEDQKPRKSISNAVIIPLGIQGLIIAGLAVAAAFISPQSPVRPAYLAIAAWAVLALSWVFMIRSISSRLPGTAISGEELASRLGEAVEKGFKDYLPKPDAMASAIGESITNAAKEMEKSAAQLGDSSAKIDEVFTKHIAGLGDRMKDILGKNAEDMKAANEKLAGELAKIAELTSDIEKVLHVQQTVENTVKSVTAADEFMETLKTLRAHIENADNLIREVTKPRKIRLVESGGNLQAEAVEPAPPPQPRPATVKVTAPAAKPEPPAEQG